MIGLVAWTTVATRPMSGRQDWQPSPHAMLTLEEVAEEVAAGRLVQQVLCDRKFDVLQVRAP